MSLSKPLLAAVSIHSQSLPKMVSTTLVADAVAAAERAAPVPIEGREKRASAGFVISPAHQRTDCPVWNKALTFVRENWAAAPPQIDKREKARAAAPTG
jgi:hypothetical protein